MILGTYPIASNLHTGTLINFFSYYFPIKTNRCDRQKAPGLFRENYSPLFLHSQPLSRSGRAPSTMPDSQNPSAQTLLTPLSMGSFVVRGHSGPLGREERNNVFVRCEDLQIFAPKQAIFSFSPTIVRFWSDRLAKGQK